MANSSFEIKINGTTPETTKVGDVAEILKSIESMIESCIAQDHPEVDEQDVVIGLVNIKSSSLGLQLQSSANGVAIEAFRSVARAISTDDYSVLPLASIDSLEKLVVVTRKYKSNTDFIINNGNAVTIATITPETIIKRPSLIRGETNLYGFIVRVGGVKPVVRMETINGQGISCTGDIEIIKKLGERLYTKVGLTGIALWDKNLTIRQFDIKSILPYRETPLEDGFRELAGVAGQYYATIDNIEEYLRSIRDDDSELE